RMSGVKHAVDVAFRHHGIAEHAEALAEPPDLVAAQTEDAAAGDDDLVAAVSSPLRAFHRFHAGCSGWRTCSTRRRRTVPARSGHSIVAPVRMPIRPAPIGVSTEIRFSPESASPG